MTTDKIEIQSLFVTEVSTLRLQAECSTSPGPYTILWGLYTVDTDRLTSLNATTTGVTIVEALDGAVYKSTLTLDDPPLGRYAYIVCNVMPGDSSSGLQPVYDSLKIDNGEIIFHIAKKRHWTLLVVIKDSFSLGVSKHMHTITNL